MGEISAEILKGNSGGISIRILGITLERISECVFGYPAGAPQELTAGIPDGVPHRIILALLIGLSLGVPDLITSHPR